MISGGSSDHGVGCAEWSAEPPSRGVPYRLPPPSPWSALAVLAPVELLRGGGLSSAVGESVILGPVSCNCGLRVLRSGVAGDVGSSTLVTGSGGGVIGTALAVSGSGPQNDVIAPTATASPKSKAAEEASLAPVLGCAEFGCADVEIGWLV